MKTRTPPPGLCALAALPDPYQCAFRQGSAHHLPGQFLPAEVDWFTQLFLLPLWLIYALPPLMLPPMLLYQWVRYPDRYQRFWQTVQQQNAVENAVMVGLLGLIGVLLVYCAWMAWEAGSSFVRTWQAHQWQRRGGHGFGLVSLEHGLVARLIDNLEGHNCIWLPREAIADILWQQIREEGAKQSRWVYRTRLCYVTAHQGQPQTRWLTLEGYRVKTDHSAGDTRSDRALFEQLDAWWRQAPPRSPHETEAES
jgi:hypothetical protein